MRLPENNCSAKPNNSSVKLNDKNVSSVANMLRNAIFTSQCNIFFALLGTFGVILRQKFNSYSTNN